MPEEMVQSTEAEETQDNPQQPEEETEQDASSSSEELESDSAKNAAREAIDNIEANTADQEADDDEDYESEEEDSDSKRDKKQASDEKKSWKLKVGGKEIEIDDESELIKRAQMGYSADQKWQEAAQMRKQLESFVETLQQDPSTALEQLGFNVDDLAEQHLQRRIEEMQKSPEELEKEKLQKELESIKKQREQELEQARQAEMKRVQEQYAVEIENQISDALDKSQTLPKKPYVVKRIADAMLLMHERGKHDVSVEDVVPLVEKEIKSDIQEMFSAMPEELVESVVGKQNLNRIRKRRVKKARQVPKKPKVNTTGEAEIQKQKAKDANKTKQKVSAKEFFKSLGTY